MAYHFTRNVQNLVQLFSSQLVNHVTAINLLLFYQKYCIYNEDVVPVCAEKRPSDVM